MNDVSFPQNVSLRSETQQRIQGSVNTLMNGLLNQPNESPFTFPQANYTHQPNEIEASVEYVYQEADISKPSDFLSAILGINGPTTTTAPPVTIVPPVTTVPITTVGPVFIFPRLVFHTNNTVPTESEVLSRGNPFLNGDEIRLNNTVRVQNLTYERLSDNSFALQLAYKMNDVSFPQNVSLRSETQQRIQGSVNTLMNGLLNQPNESPFTFPQANYTHQPNEIEASVEYVYQEADISKPSDFLSAILGINGPTTTTAPPVTIVPPVTTVPITTVGPVFIFPRLVFHTTNTVPTESEVLSRGNPFLNGDEIRLNNTVRVQNLTYERLSDNSFALQLAYKMNDVSFPQNVSLRSETQQRIQGSVNTLMNGLLNQPNESPFTFPQANYTHQPNEIEASVEYVYQEADISKPSDFLSAILGINGPVTTTAPPVTTAPNTVVGTVFIFFQFVFHTLLRAPDESEVLSKVIAFLNRRASKLNPVSIDELTYQRLTPNSFALRLSYKIDNVTFPEKFELRQETQQRIQESANSLLNGLLGSPGAEPFTFPNGNYTHMDNEIHANVTYVYREGDIQQPSPFLSAVLQVSGLVTTAAPTTTSSSPVLLLITSTAGRFPGWALAIIIPIGVVLILLPFWILLCCLLCGCCAAIKRRWRRRQAYHLQQYVVHPI
ncbi:uncharacterized protein LOC133130052 [Conger conger]|uniref:uncharacterized protein LOC133130052 n=1 Tax=Conger conger TaxID=82655 RepID=UPI002A5A66D5|nr:uncharacterized protein LOC133130052 [Conger conger]